MDGSLISVLFSARDYAHVLHLKTQSYAMHMALESFYDGLLDAADAICESAQGKYGLLEVDTAGADFEGKDEVGFVADFAAWAETEGKKLIPTTDTYLLNQLDEVVALAYRTKYKLENLK